MFVSIAQQQHKAGAARAHTYIWPDCSAVFLIYPVSTWQRERKNPMKNRGREKCERWNSFKCSLLCRKGVIELSMQMKKKTDWFPFCWVWNFAVSSKMGTGLDGEQFISLQFIPASIFSEYIWTRRDFLRGRITSNHPSYSEIGGSAIGCQSFQFEICGRHLVLP